MNWDGKQSPNRVPGTGCGSFTQISYTGDESCVSRASAHDAGPVNVVVSATIVTVTYCVGDVPAGDGAALDDIAVSAVLPVVVVVSTAILGASLTPFS